MGEGRELQNLMDNGTVYYPVSMIMKFSNTIIMIWLTNGRDQNLRIDAIVFMSSTKKLLYGLLAIRAMDCCNWPDMSLERKVHIPEISLGVLPSDPPVIVVANH